MELSDSPDCRGQPLLLATNAQLRTATFLFADIEGSTRLWEAHPEAMRVSLARHDSLMRRVVDEAHGQIFKTTGDGFCAAFALSYDALTAAIAAQLALRAEQWPSDIPITARMALHTGIAETREEDYFGPTLNRLARLLACAHGGQILISQATLELCRDWLPADVSFEDLGFHTLKDLSRPERIYQVRTLDLLQTFPPLRSLSKYPNNLPQQLTSFVGRANEISAIEARLAATRVVTITGPGGSGKTRMSIQIGAEVSDQFEQGVWFVDLASITEGLLVHLAVAAVLHVRERPATSIAESLVAEIDQKHLLLILNNCEHVLNSCAELADSLLAQCPNLKIINTSRERLGISGEQICSISPLSLPDPNRSYSAHEVETYESTQLFVDRARLVRPDFHITDRNASSLAALCSHLDGIPLAIELAASRVASLSIEEINRRLAHRFQLLVGGPRTYLPRHRALRLLIEWSYNLLNNVEQQLLRSLAVFAAYSGPR